MKKKKPRLIRRKIINLPHLKTIVVVSNKKDSDEPDGCEAYTKRLCAEEIVMRLPLPITGPHSGAVLAHEIIHVLQYLIDDTSASFGHEREHMAYIAGYLFEEISKM